MPDMASSQPFTSSPARSPASPDRFALSPQARLKKLLATVDSDSDDDTTKKTSTKPLEPRGPSPTANRGSHASVHESDDEDDAPRPRGRLAARMHGGSSKGANDAMERVRKLLEKDASKPDVEMTGTNADVDSDGEDEILRPRGRLAARMLGLDQPAKDDTKKRATSSFRQLAEDAGPAVIADDDEDEDILIRRRLKSRQRRPQTPEPATITSQKDSSPGLFVTPSKSPPSTQESPAAESDSDDELPSLRSERFKALVEKKRQERLVREAEEEEKKLARAAALVELGDDNDDNASDISDDEGGRQLTQRQKSRPSRKASKKAIEEMNRETQRMQRAMQLAHEAKTKKKIAKSSLFERFNFKPSGGASAKDNSSSRPQTPISTKSTDAEMQDASTPPSSPPARVEDVLGKDLGSGSEQTGGAAASISTAATDRKGQGDEDDGHLPDIMDIEAFARRPLPKDKGKTTESDLEAKPSTKLGSERQIRVKMPSIQAYHVSLGSDDDDELLVVNKKTKFDAIFDRIPKNRDLESKSLRLQRQLAHIDSPERKAYKKIDKKAMTPNELHAHLQQRAREQAKLERERRLEMLKAKGIHIQTEEERERDREAIEDMVARARREAEEIMDRERDEAKAERKARGDDPLAWDESGSEDDDYTVNDDAEDAGDEEDDEVELSGSEEEDSAGAESMIVDGDDAEEQEEQAAQADAVDAPKKTSTTLNAVDEVADEGSEREDSGSETEQSWVDPDEEEEKHRWGDEEDVDEAPAFVQARRPRQPLAPVSDDEDMEVETTPKPLKTHFIDFTPQPTSAQAINFTPHPKSNSTSPSVPTSVLRSAAKTFIPGLPVNAGGPAGLGLTQIFAGTMDDSQVGALDGSSPSQPMPTFDHFPDSQFSQNVTDSTDAMVLDSQTVPATQVETQIQLDFSQSQMHGLDSLLRDDLASQPSQIIEPTQDGGFQDWTPLKERFVDPPQSTVDTVIRDISQPDDEMPHESPLVQKRTRIRRKAVIASDTEDEDGDELSTKPSAFNIMKDAAAIEKKRKAREDFDKRKSKAKEMVHEQAEESEDEYAGLGGVDGEDSDDDGADVKEMIDDQIQGNKDDEVKIAALHA